MKKTIKKDKFACFQWIRDARAEMTRDMTGMTIEQRVDYMHAKAQTANRDLPQYSPEEAKKKLAEFLADPVVTQKTTKPKQVPAHAKPAARKSTPARRKTPTPA